MRRSPSSPWSAPSPKPAVEPPAPRPDGLPADEDDDLYGDDALHDRYEDIKRGEIHLTELQKMTMPQLIRTAKAEGVVEFTGLKKQDLIFKILKERVKQNGLMFGEGTLEVLPGRLRLPPEPRLQLPPLPRRHLRLAQPDPPVRPQDRRHRRRPDPPAQGE